MQHSNAKISSRAMNLILPSLSGQTPRLWPLTPKDWQTVHFRQCRFRDEIQQTAEVNGRKATHRSRQRGEKRPRLTCCSGCSDRDAVEYVAKPNSGLAAVAQIDQSQASTASGNHVPECSNIRRPRCDHNGFYYYPEPLTSRRRTASTRRMRSAARDFIGLMHSIPQSRCALLPEAARWAHARRKFFVLTDMAGNARQTAISVRVP